MTPARIPDDEASRLAALRELEVLDTAPEAEFDALVRAASLVCGVPISLISLVDTDRQWFKANIGLEAATETPRDLAFCAHAILGEAVFEVPDASQDQRFADNPLVTADPDIRFYAGAPLVLGNGAHVGTLCVIDRQPRQLSAQQTAVLSELATAASKALEARRAAVAERRLLLAEARSQALIAHILALSPDGYAALETDQRIIHCSPRFAALAGMAMPDPGMTLADLLSHLHAAAGQPAPVDPADPLSAPLKLVLPGPPQRAIELSLHLSPGEALPRLLQLRDVTQQFDLDQMKSEFLATAAHELRTPMTSLSGFAELLLTRDISVDRQREIAGRVHRQCQALMALTTDLLDLAHLEAKGRHDLELRPLCLAAEVELAAQDFQPPSGRLAPQLELGRLSATQVVADKGRLRQILLNLLSNAYKYSPQGGDVVVRLVQSTDAPQQISFEVEDHGMGMTAEQLAHVSEKFFRADRSGPIQGTGLGMNIVKRLVTLLNGSLHLRSAPAQGTCVRVNLPILGSQIASNAPE